MFFIYIYLFFNNIFFVFFLHDDEINLPTYLVIWVKSKQSVCSAILLYSGTFYSLFLPFFVLEIFKFKHDKVFARHYASISKSHLNSCVQGNVNQIAIFQFFKGFYRQLYNLLPWSQNGAKSFKRFYSEIYVYICSNLNNNNDVFFNTVLQIHYINILDKLYKLQNSSLVGQGTAVRMGRFLVQTPWRT